MLNLHVVNRCISNYRLISRRALYFYNLFQAFLPHLPILLPQRYPLNKVVVVNCSLTLASVYMKRAS
jgi:hypothetical protein